MGLDSKLEIFSISIELSFIFWYYQRVLLFYCCQK